MIKYYHFKKGTMAYRNLLSFSVKGQGKWMNGSRLQNFLEQLTDKIDCLKRCNNLG